MRPSASSLHRLMRCAASHVLESADSSGSAAETGTLVHEYLDRVLVADRAGAQTTLAVPSDELAVKLQRLPVAEMVDGLVVLETEHAYVWDARDGTPRRLGRLAKARDYGALKDWEVPCTIDVIGRSKRGGHLVVKDWKSGKDLGDPRDSWQLTLGALCVDDGGEGVEVQYHYVDIEQGTHRMESAFLPGELLDERADDIRRAMGAFLKMRAAYADGVVPDVREGDWCAYCPAMHLCHAKTAMVRAFSEELGTIESAIGMMSIEKAGATWARVKEYEWLLERASNALKLRAQVEPLPLPSGKLLKMAERDGREYLHKDSTLALLRELGATEEQIKKVTNRGRSYLVATEAKR